jgi:sporulation protein YlmC with PRC-barrel domain
VQGRNNIFNPSGDNLGKINDMMIDISDGKVEYLVIECGGFLGMNQKYFAVPMQALTIANEHKNAFILNETKESLKRYPGFDKDLGQMQMSISRDATSPY